MVQDPGLVLLPREAYRARAAPGPSDRWGLKPHKHRADVSRSTACGDACVSVPIKTPPPLHTTSANFSLTSECQHLRSLLKDPPLLLKPMLELVLQTVTTELKCQSIRAPGDTQ